MKVKDIFKLKPGPVSLPTEVRDLRAGSTFKKEVETDQGVIVKELFLILGISAPSAWDSETLFKVSAISMHLNNDHKTVSVGEFLCISINKSSANFFINFSSITKKEAAVFSNYQIAPKELGDLGSICLHEGYADEGENDVPF